VEKPGDSAFAQVGGDQGLLRVVSNSQLDAMQKGDLSPEDLEQARVEELRNNGIAGHIRNTFQTFKRERTNRNIDDRLIAALRAYRGEYPPEKLVEIEKFGGSKVFSRLSTLKCRGATAMLRDIYLAGDRPWFVEPTPKPTLPEDITKSLLELVNVEIQSAQLSGAEISEDQIKQRLKQLTKSAEKAARAQAQDEAEEATRYLDDMLVEGGFYDSLVEFLHYITVFPYAFMKGPVVRMATDVKWENGVAVVKDVAKMYWTAPNPMDIYWSSGIRRFADSEVIEHLRLSRTDLNNMLGVPGYNDEAIREVLDIYGKGGLVDWVDAIDSERAELEDRENPHQNPTGLIDALEFHGKIQGNMLLDYGYTEDEVPDKEKDYACTAWLIDHYLIKVQLDPSPRKRHGYYMTSFEKVPGAIVGHGLPEILNDIQDVANASLRAMVNNLSISSGPQVVINDDRVNPVTDSDELYPWKRWHVNNDPYGSSLPAIDFYQPNSNSQQLLAVYQNMTTIADELSSIPRYMTGSERIGGAGRTASGLSMLMQNAGKVLQSVAANIDSDIFSPLLQGLYDTVLLTDESSTLRGDEQIRVRGVVFANQRETERARMLEFLQLTANDMDAQIVGPQGRAELLREIAERIGLDHKNIVPEDPQTFGAPPAMGNVPAGAPPPEAGAVEEGIRGDMRGPSGRTV
jgi:hypothetical protein